MTRFDKNYCSVPCINIVKFSFLKPQLAVELRIVPLKEGFLVLHHGLSIVSETSPSQYCETFVDFKNKNSPN